MTEVAYITLDELVKIVKNNPDEYSNSIANITLHFKNMPFPFNYVDGIIYLKEDTVRCKYKLFNEFDELVETLSFKAEFFMSKKKENIVNVVNVEEQNFEGYIQP